MSADARQTLWIGLLLFTSMAPATMPAPAAPAFLAAHFADGAYATGWFFSIALLAQFLFAPVAGWLSDRLQTRSALIASACAVNAGCFLMMAQAADYPTLLLLRFFEGASSAFVAGLLLSLAADRDRNGARRGLATGLSGMMMMLGAATGLLVGGIAGRAEPALAFELAGAAMFGNALLCALFLRDPETIEASPEKLASALKLVRSSPAFFFPITLAFADRLCAGFLVSAFSAHLQRDLLLDAAVAGRLMALVMTPMSLLSIPFALLARRGFALQLSAGGSIVYGVGLAAASILPDSNAVALALLLAGLGGAAMFSPSIALAMELAPQGARASVMSAYVGAGSLGFLMGPLLAAALVDLGERHAGALGGAGLAGIVFGGLEVVLAIALWLSLGGRLRARESAINRSA
jgi:MFS family permease